MKGLLSVIEAAEYLGLSKITIYKLVSEQKIPVVKLGARDLFRVDDLDKWVESKIIWPKDET